LSSALTKVQAIIVVIVVVAAILAGVYYVLLQQPGGPGGQEVTVELSGDFKADIVNIGKALEQQGINRVRYDTLCGLAAILIVF